VKRASTFFLKVILCLIAIGALASMIWFPQAEGRAVHLGLISIYTDPFILYLYVASIPFFWGLWQAFKLANLIDANKTFSQGAIHTLKNIKFASLSLIGFIAGAILYIRFFVQGDDPAGPTMLGISMILAFGLIAIAATVLIKSFSKSSRRKV